MALDPGHIQYSPWFVAYVVSCFSINFWKVQNGQYCKKLMDISLHFLPLRTIPLQEANEYISDRIVLDVLFRVFRFSKASLNALPWHLHSQHFEFYTPSWHWEVRNVAINGNFVISQVKLQNYINNQDSKSRTSLATSCFLPLDFFC